MTIPAQGKEEEGRRRAGTLPMPLPAFLQHMLTLQQTRGMRGTTFLVAVNAMLCFVARAYRRLIDGVTFYSDAICASCENLLACSLVRAIHHVLKRMPALFSYNVLPCRFRLRDTITAPHAYLIILTTRRRTAYYHGFLAGVFCRATAAARIALKIWTNIATGGRGVQCCSAYGTYAIIAACLSLPT